MIKPAEQETGSGHPAGELAFKRIFDVVISIFILFAIWPIIIITALIVKLSSPGPIFYRGIRSGLNGRTFKIFKFRTMVMNAESLGGPTTGTNDVRVTSAGRFLRRTKLDELPQFLNVLKGDMSLVGPRPEVIEYTSRYRGKEKLILTMRPGITDYASIEFAGLDDLVGSENPDAYFKQYILPRKNELRLRYVEEWSITSDFHILRMTLIRVLQRIYKK